MAESVTGENSFGNLHMQTVSRGRSKCPWRGLEVEHLSEIFRFFRRDRFEGQECDLECNPCRDGEPVQSSQNRGDVIASPCPRNHPCECVEDPLQLPEVLGGCSMENGVTVVETGSDHRTCHHTSRLLVDTSTYMTQGSDVEMSSLTYIVHVSVEGEIVVESDAKALHCFGNRDLSVTKSRHSNFTLSSIPGARADNDHFGFVRVECKAVLREPSVDRPEAAAQSEQRVVVTKLDVKLRIIGILGMMDAKRRDDTSDRCDVGGE